MRKIDFTCKEISLKDLIQCNYGLNESEYTVFSYIMQSSSGLSVKDLVIKIKKDRTTVQKILTKLMKKNLLEKRQVNLDRGFMFVYYSKDQKYILDNIEKNIESYYKLLKDSFMKWKNALN